MALKRCITLASLAKMWHFKFKVLIFRIISDQSIADAGYPHITRLPQLMSWHVGSLSVLFKEERDR
jgi:hypothetical protein